MAPLPALTLPSRAVLEKTNVKELTAKTQRDVSSVGIDQTQQALGYRS